jgi:hypothetical protein
MSKTPPSLETPDGVKVFTAPPVPHRVHRARPPTSGNRDPRTEAPPTTRR